MFPLNDFLAQQIYRVTTFLREISVRLPRFTGEIRTHAYRLQAPPETTEPPSEDESFDFGSCVALHRFLYDHWDQVRQRLVSQERKDYVRSPAESTRGRSPVLQPLRNLISNLGPPPLAVTWNRPQISANPPQLYSRFQDFMLRNAFRSTESFVTARAVYDGGESKVCHPSFPLPLRLFPFPVDPKPLRFQLSSCAFDLADHRTGWPLRHLHYTAQHRH